MAVITDFNYFDPKEEYAVSFGELPHWEQPGATYFVTFRTADSMPQSVLDSWRRERDDWLSHQTKNFAAINWCKKRELLPDGLKEQFDRIFCHKYELKLDRGLGACPFNDPQLAKIVADSLLHFDGLRYHLGDFIVMPNHVHLLVCFINDVRLRQQCYSWKHFTAGSISKVTGQQGKFWQAESFDHLVRDLEHFRKFQRYIKQNPIKAGLQEQQFIHYEFEKAQ